MAKALEILVSGRFVPADSVADRARRLASGDPLLAAMEYARVHRHSLLALRLVRDAALRGWDTTLKTD
jgi:hypothetical protein